MDKIKIFLNQNDCHAEAEYDPDTNVTTILAGSQWAPKKNAIPNGVSKLRDEIENSHVVDANGKFEKNQPIVTRRKGRTSLSTAGGVILGRSAQGTKEWVVREGEKETAIDDCLKEKKVLDANGRFIQPANRKEKNNPPQAIGENEPQDMSSNKEIQDYLHQNIIFYGVPGCGKSYFIKNLLKVKDDDEKIIDMPLSYYKRILFHPEYSYSDFVGQLRPVTKGKNITYQFAPGPFTEILRDSYLNPKNDYFLIIEEINRGNAPAIFGDLFQLLDRDYNGESEYSIYNKDMLGYFDDVAAQNKDENTELLQKTRDDGIKLPKNLTIFATMNTCDQNVFTLDTAFKRRWRMSRIKNDINAFPTWPIFNTKKLTWQSFAKAVNDAILSNCNDGTAAEDKQLGAYFVKENDVQDVRRFAEKVLLYLWDDVAKYDKSQLFDTKNYKTLDMVIDGFVEGENVFSPNCAQLQELYNNMKQAKQTDENAAGVPSGVDPGTDSSKKNAATDEE